MCYKTLKKVVRITLLNNSDHLIFYSFVFLSAKPYILMNNKKKSSSLTFYDFLCRELKIIL